MYRAVLVFDYTIDARDIEIRENKCLSLKPPKRPVLEYVTAVALSRLVYGFRDTGYLPFYFQGYGILCSIFLFTLRDIGYLGTLIMGEFASP